MTSSARRRARRPTTWPVAAVVIVAIVSALMAAGFAVSPDSSQDAGPQGPAARASVVEGPELTSCNDCHKGVCGKSATSMADCIDCHKTGVTEEWASEAR